MKPAVLVLSRFPCAGLEKHSAHAQEDACQIHNVLAPVVNAQYTGVCKENTLIPALANASRKEAISSARAVGLVAQATVLIREHVSRGCAPSNETGNVTAFSVCPNVLATLTVVVQAAVHHHSAVRFQKQVVVHQILQQSANHSQPLQSVLAKYALAAAAVARHVRLFILAWE